MCKKMMTVSHKDTKYKMEIISDNQQLLGEILARYSLVASETQAYTQYRPLIKATVIFSMVSREAHAGVRTSIPQGHANYSPICLWCFPKGLRMSVSPEERIECLLHSMGDTPDKHTITSAISKFYPVFGKYCYEIFMVVAKLQHPSSKLSESTRKTYKIMNLILGNFSTEIKVKLITPQGFPVNFCEAFVLGPNKITSWRDSRASFELTLGNAPKDETMYDKYERSILVNIFPEDSWGMTAEEMISDWDLLPNYRRACRLYYLINMSILDMCFGEANSKAHLQACSHATGPSAEFLKSWQPLGLSKESQGFLASAWYLSDIQCISIDNPFLETELFRFLTDKAK